MACKCFRLHREAYFSFFVDSHPYKKSSIQDLEAEMGSKVNNNHVS